MEHIDTSNKEEKVLELPVASGIGRLRGKVPYVEGAELIRNLIRSQGLPAGSRLPSVRELASQLNVSTMTALKILESLEAEGVVCRIHGKGTFVNEVQRGEYRVQCLIDHFYLQTSQDSYLHDVFVWNQRWFSDKGNIFSTTVLSDTRELPYGAQMIFGTPRPHGVVVGSKLHDKWVHLVEESGLPAVAFNRLMPEGSPVSSVLPDNRQGAIDVARYLWDLGHRRVAVLCADVQGWSEFAERRDACMEYWKARGAGNGIFVYDIDHSDPAITDLQYDQALDEILATVKPTAIIGCSDYSAAAAYPAIKRHGLGIPGDISVVGFLDLPLATQLDPPLTTVAVNAREIGFKAAELLDECILGRATGGQVVRMPVELVIRQSAAKPSR